MIEQDVDGENHWTVIKLADKNEDTDSSTITGTWRATSQSHNDKEPYFTSSNPEYWFWQWTGPHAGTMEIGVKTGRASHREDEKEVFQVLIKLDRIRRTAGSKWEIGSVMKPGTGTLTYNVGNDFRKGDIHWSPNRYDRD
jgi:hypothetical protein